MPRFEFSGRVVTGRGEGAFFTGADWARRSFKELLGIDPWPGTMNLELDDPDSLAAWRALKETRGLPVETPDPRWCDARCFPVVVAERERGAIVLPDVADYAPNRVEIIAARNLREALGLEDGDAVKVTATG